MKEEIQLAEIHEKTEIQPLNRAREKLASLKSQINTNPLQRISDNQTSEDQTSIPQMCEMRTNAEQSHYIKANYNIIPYIMRFEDDSSQISLRGFESESESTENLETKNSEIEMVAPPPLKGVAAQLQSKDLFLRSQISKPPASQASKSPLRGKSFKSPQSGLMRQPMDESGNFISSISNARNGFTGMSGDDMYVQNFCSEKSEFTEQKTSASDQSEISGANKSCASENQNFSAETSQITEPSTYVQNFEANKSCFSGNKTCVPIWGADTTPAPPPNLIKGISPLLPPLDTITRIQFQLFRMSTAKYGHGLRTLKLYAWTTHDMTKINNQAHIASEVYFNLMKPRSFKDGVIRNKAKGTIDADTSDVLIGIADQFEKDNQNKCSMSQENSTLAYLQLKGKNCEKGSTVIADQFACVEWRRTSDNLFLPKITLCIEGAPLQVMLGKTNNTHEKASEYVGYYDPLDYNAYRKIKE
jgi:hypothetical protein